MAASSRRRGAGKLQRSEMIWGYIFVAAPIIGFLLFGAIPLMGSLLLGFTRWDMTGDPTWVGTTNYARLFTLSVNELPRELDPETGEVMFRCGRERVPESQVAALLEQTDPITRAPYVCEPRFQRAGSS
jgi:ABC-type sugar transport system permease subunit